MHRRTFFASLLVCPICPAVAQIPTGTLTPEWNYDSAGPQTWESLSPAFDICGTGDQQSPIDLRNGIKARVAPIHLSWRSGRFTVVNNSHSIQANVPPGSSAKIGPEEFNLTQFHFHLPSEHAVSGKQSAMEAHFVHTHADGRLAVLAALLEPGEPNLAFSEVMKVAPATSGKEAETEAVVDPREMIPPSLDSWRYEGSLTTPPCSQIVSWVVFARPVTVAQSDINSFRKIFLRNARPLQKVNRRYLLRGQAVI